MTQDQSLQERAINTLRFLSADAIQKANSGHPGLPMGTAAIGYTIWTKHMKYNPKNPNWFDRDRFILSGGHGSMLLYSLLHLTGFDLSLDELKNFRQWGSLTPGHPEFGLTPGIETTTGPLGQGLSNGVGMAIAEAHLAKIFNRPGHQIVDHYTYAIVTDGDLMEGVASEAASLAGHLKLGKLIYFYDDNRISIEGSTEIAFTEDRGKRFEAYGWHVLYVEDGNAVDELDAAIAKAKADPRPSLIVCRTHIGYGLPTKQDTAKAHGSPPGDEELDNAKKNMNWPVEPRFFIPDDALELFRQAIPQGETTEAEWNKKFEAYRKAYPGLAAEFERRMSGLLPENWEESLPVFPADEKGLATRASSGKVMNAIAEALPELMGGSADLAPSTKTWLDHSEAFDVDTPEGRNIHFGVREHGMGSIVNGMAFHKGFIPFGSTFLVFSDYLRPTVRIAALSHIQTVWVFTHDSIGVGEDGPTHQPIEHMAAMRSIPNLVNIRPADANETSEAWASAIQRQNGPTMLALTRQNLPTLDRSEFNSAKGLHKGAYVLKDFCDGQPDLILMASGSEVQLMIESAKLLSEKGIKVRVVSFPSWELFAQQEQSYKDSVLLPDVENRIAIEAGVTQGWERWVGSKGKIIGIDHFGASAPAGTIFKNFGFTTENVVKTAEEMLSK